MTAPEPDAGPDAPRPAGRRPAPAGPAPAAAGRRATLAGLAACLAFLPLPAPAVTARGDALLSGDDFAGLLLVEINAERARHGFRPLAPDARLTTAARHQAGIMANARLMEHEIPGTPGFGARLRAARARVRRAGENILRDNLSRYGLGCAAVSASLPERLAPEIARVSAPRWIGSPEHLHNITDSRFRRAGAAFAIVAAGPGCGQIYVAQVFGG